MRIKFSILLACSLALLSVSCIKEALGLTPIDKGDVSLDLYGFVAEGQSVRYSSDRGLAFNPFVHNELNIDGNGKFAFKFERNVASSNDDSILFVIGMSGGDEVFELNKEYSLGFDGGRLWIGDECYTSTTGMIVFTKLERKRNDYLVSAEFRFVAQANGHEVTVLNGKLSKCRVCRSENGVCAKLEDD